MGDFDSQSLLPAGRRDIPERPAVAVEHGFLARIFLETSANHIGVTRVQLHQPGCAPAAFAGDQSGPRSSEEVSDDVPGLAAAEQCALDRLHRLHRGMQPVGCRLPFFPQSRLRFIAVAAILLASDVAVEQGLMLKFITAKTPREGILGPDDLAAHLKASRFQCVLELSLPRGRVACIQLGAELDHDSARAERSLQKPAELLIGHAVAQDLQGGLRYSPHGPRCREGP